MPRDARAETIMALKVELKPGERIIVGECVITNADQRTRLLIDGHVAILREKDILTPETANTPAKLIYLAVQLMYTAKTPESHHAVYFDLLRDFLSAVPSAAPLVAEINDHILAEDLYKALKSARLLIDYERKLREKARPRAATPARKSA
jgi:flagellar protein FlbT